MSLRKVTEAVFEPYPLVPGLIVLGICRLNAAQDTDRFSLNHWLSSSLSVHAYVISLPTSSERRARMSSRLKYHHVPFSFVDGMQPEVHADVSRRSDAHIAWHS